MFPCMLVPVYWQVEMGKRKLGTKVKQVENVPQKPAGLSNSVVLGVWSIIATFILASCIHRYWDHARAPWAHRFISTGSRVACWCPQTETETETGRGRERHIGTHRDTDRQTHGHTQQVPQTLGLRAGASDLFWQLEQVPSVQLRQEGRARVCRSVGDCWDPHSCVWGSHGDNEHGCAAGC